jgi:hypothetical protein
MITPRPFGGKGCVNIRWKGIKDIYNFCIRPFS